MVVCFPFDVWIRITNPQQQVIKKQTLVFCMLKVRTTHKQLKVDIQTHLYRKFFCYIPETPFDSCTQLKLTTMR